MTQEPIELTKGMAVEVVATNDPGGEAVSAQVVLASANGKSVALMMDGGIRTANGGLILGPLPLVREDDGSYHELFTGTPVTVKLP